MTSAVVFAILPRWGRVAGLAATFWIAGASAQERYFDVPAQAASSGVREFARQAGIQAIAAGPAVERRDTNAVRGRLETRAALQRLLAGTGLVVRSFDGRLAVLEADPDADAGRPPPLLDRVVATGTRMRGLDRLSPAPVAVTRMEDAARLGHTSAHDALMLDPAMGIGQGLAGGGNRWDAGIATANLRNLGTGRSLTLIDGRRRVASSARTAAVDMGMIPAGMIERIEVVTGGSAATYGADAVTGAVNIVTRREIDATHASVSSGLSSRGDAAEHQVSLSTGGGFAGDRGRFAIGGTWSRVAPLVYADRLDWRDYPYHIANPANTGIGDGIPDHVRIDRFRQIYFDYRPNYFLDGKEWIVENGVPREARYDTLYSPGEFSMGDGGDGRNLYDDASLRAGLDSLALMGRADVDLDGGLALGGHLSYARQRYEAGGPQYRDDSRRAWFSGAGGAVAYLDNPYLPDGVRRAMEAHGLDRLDISRTYGHFPKREYAHDRETVTLGQTLSGPAGAYRTWSVFWQYGRARDAAVERNIARKSHWIAARDVVADPLTGEPVCRDPAARAAGCLPLDIFGLAPPSAALLDYVMADRHEKRVNTQRILGAKLEGGLLALPAGEASATFGIEYRKDTLRTTDDPLALAGELQYDLGPQPRPELDVGFEASEAYAGITVPVLAGATLGERLELEAAYRHARYSTIGGTGARKVGVVWSPWPALVLRAARSRSVRPPNFGELYDPRVTAQQGSIDDPCEAGAYHASRTRADNCLALGVATPLPDVKVGPSVTTEGNPDLAPETSDIASFGIALGPRALPGLELSADYWDIDIADAITQFHYSTLLRLCVDLPSIDNPYCGLSVREAPLGNPVSVTARQLNVPRLRARGVDLAVGLRSQARPGFALSLKATRLLEHTIHTLPGDRSGDVTLDGGWQAPHLRATLRAQARVGRLDLLWQARFRSASTYDLHADSDESYPDNRVPSTTYHDVAVRYRLGEGAWIGFGIRNLFDRQRPHRPGIYEDYTTYDMVGRYLHARLDLEF